MAERTISATEARVHFGEVLDSVVKNLDIVYVQRGGRLAAVIVPLEEWKRYREQDDPWTRAARSMEAHWKYMEEARQAGRIKDVEVDIEELERASREERDERILGYVRGQ